MNILICGATGFVGRHLCQALTAAGHQLTRVVRTANQPNDIQLDFLNATTTEHWLPHLASSIEVVINCVGVLRNSSATPMQVLHTDTPRALFQASKLAGIKRVVHISALGVDSGVAVPYFSTRLATEHFLQQSGLNYLCLRPSVIYGEDGDSAQMFRQLAKLPLQVLPLGGSQTLQPVHIDDVCQAVVNWLQQPAPSAIIAAVGQEATTMREMLDSYRQQLGYDKPLHIGLPRFATALIAKAGDFVSSAPLCSDTYAMMAAGNTADKSEFSRLLGREPRNFRQFIAASHH